MNTSTNGHGNGNGPAPPVAASSPMGPRKPRRLLCLKEVCHRVGLARATVYRELDELRQAGPRPFPLPVQVSPGRIAWHEHEIEAWIESLPRVGPGEAAQASTRTPPDGTMPSKR